MYYNIKIIKLHEDPSLQAKDTWVVPLATRLLKVEAPAEQFHWMQSKLILSNQTIHKKKSSAKQKTIMAVPVKNESCHVCDEILPKKVYTIDI